MTGWILAREAPVRLGFFLLVFILIAVWEVVTERRPRSQPRGPRWLANLGFAVLSTAFLRLVFPVAGVEVALLVERQGAGLLHRWDLPYGLAVSLSVVLLDLAIYLQHVMFHAVPALWRIHRVHHADQDVDLTTGIRFHPAEIGLSAAFQLGVVVALGPPPLAVLILAVLLNATSIFNHGNVRLPAAAERWLRWLVATPDMHRVHHSVEIDESNRNFGFNLPWWDRLFGTYHAQPRLGHERMRLGVDELRQPEPRSLPALLALPFRGTTGRDSVAGGPRPAGDRGGEPESPRP